MKSVFISSTFKDMQAERDLLHERIFPRLRKIIGEYGEDIQELDLRWGVDTTDMSEEESSHQVLRVCIDAIDRCHPYIVVLLGERYGWIPDPEVVDSLRDERISAWYEKQMSITNLEIKYGALSEEETLRSCIFCFRSPKLIGEIDEAHRALYAAESPLHEERLNALKEQIRAKEGAIILEYEAGWDAGAGRVCGLERFGEELYARLAQLVRRDFAGQKTAEPREGLLLQMERLSEQYLSVYVPRYRMEEGILREMRSYEVLYDARTNTMLAGKAYPRVLITGEAGSGKSAVMASVERRAREAGYTTILYFSGNSGCQSLDVLKDFMIYRLEEICGLPHEAAGSKEERLRFLAGQTGERKIYCFIDALDQLFENQAGGRLDILNLCPNFYYVLSASSEYPADELVKDYIWPVRVDELEPFTATERKELIGRTAAKRGKKLDEVLTEKTLRAPGAGNPLYLSMVLQRYFMMDQREFEAAEALAPGMEGIHRYMEKLLSSMPRQAKPMARYLLEVTGERFGLAWFWEILKLLVLSEYGLSEKELAGLLSVGGMRFLQLEFQQLVSYLYDAFSLREDGKWVFAHRLFAEAVKEQMSEEERSSVWDLLIRYSLEEEEFLRQEGFIYILRQRHEASRQILERAKGWESRQRVLDFVGRMAVADADSRDWLLKLTGSVSADLLCEFWFSFRPENYAPDFAEFLLGLWNMLSEKPELSDEQRFVCLVKLADYYGETDREKTFSYLEQAKPLCERMAEPERSRRLALLLARRARRRVDFGGRQEWEAARGEYEAAFRILKPFVSGKASGKQDETVLQDIENKIEYAALSGDYEGDYREPILRECLEELALCRESAAEEDCMKAEARCYMLLAADYLSQNHYDSEKCLACGKKALELSAELVRKNPSPENLRQRMKIVDSYSMCLKPEFCYPYREEYLSIVRRLYERYPNDYWKEYLAYSCCMFGEAVDSAVMNRSRVFPEDLRRRAEQSYEEGFRLYGELMEGGEEFVRRRYEAFLRRKAAVDEKQGYRKEALRKALLCRELLEKISQGKTWKMRDVNLIAARAYCEVCQAGKALPYAKGGLKLAIAEEKAAPGDWLLYARCLYYLQRDEEALKACGEAEALQGALKEKQEESGQEAVRAELAYIRCRILLKQGQWAKTRKYRQVFEDFCADKKGGWEYGQSLLLKGDSLLAEGKTGEALTAFEEADTFWGKRCDEERHYFTSYERRQGYYVYERGNRIYRKPYRAESGFYMRASYYRLYSRYRRLQLAQKWDGKLSSILGYVYSTIEEDALYSEWLWLPANVPAFARLTAMIPEKIKEKWLPRELVKPPALNLARQAARIAAKEGEASASELFKETKALYEQVRRSKGEYVGFSYSDEMLSEQFQMDEGKAEERVTGASDEQRYLFANESASGPRAWYPLLELFSLVWRHREQLSSGEIEELYEESQSCLINAGVLQGEAADGYRLWDVSPLSEDALKLALQSLDDEKKRNSLQSKAGRDGKSACALELYGRTGEEEYLLCRLREFIGLDIFLRDSGFKSNEQTRKELAESAAAFLCQALEKSGAGTAARLFGQLRAYGELRNKLRTRETQELRKAFLTALEGSPDDWTKLREQMEEFWQDGYRIRWEQTILKERGHAV